MRKNIRVGELSEQQIKDIRHSEMNTGTPVGNEFPHDPDAPINNPDEWSNPFAPKR